jgi:guanylate kinase
MLVISGPSGSGKSTIARKLLDDPRVKFSVSATTRTPRAGEVDGRDYHFISKERFREMIEQGAFIEHAECTATCTARCAPDGGGARGGRVYLLEIDVQGALQLKTLGVPGLYVFIAPPDFEELRRRSSSAPRTPEVIERRLRKAEDEWRERVKYDHIVVNDDLARAVGEIRGLVGL